MVERAFVLPPQSFLGQISDDDYRAMVYGSGLDEKYRERVDDYTAYEELAELKEKKAEEAEKKAKEAEKEKAKSSGRKSSGTSKKKTSYTKKVADRTVGNAASAIGRGLGNMISKKLFR